MATERSVNVRVRLRGGDQFKKDMASVNASLSGMSGWLDVTKGQYLNLTLQMGMTVREAMLEKMRTVFEICDLRAEARRKERKRG